MSELTRRSQFPLLPDLTDLLDPFHLVFGGRATEALGIRVESWFEEGAYLVRAELPGIDPDKDVELTVTDGIMTIRAERTEWHEGRHHSEFRYGTYARSVRLPEGAKQEEISAAYEKGILTITVALEKEVKPVSRTIKISTVE